MSTIDALPPVPLRGDPLFPTVAETFLAGLPTFRTQVNTVAGEVLTNKTAAEAAAAAALVSEGVAAANLAAAGDASASAAAALASKNAAEAAAAQAASIMGAQSVWIPAGAMMPRLTNGPSIGAVETATNKVMLQTLDFDQATAEFAQFTIAMPKSWNAGTVTFKALFSHASGTGNVIFSLAGVSFASDDAMDAAFGTAVAHGATTVGTANDIYISATSGAVTIAGAGKSEYVTFQVARDVSDTLNADARLHGIQLFYTTDAMNDA